MVILVITKKRDCIYSTLILCISKDRLRKPSNTSFSSTIIICPKFPYNRNRRHVYYSAVHPVSFMRQKVGAIKMTLEMNSYNLIPIIFFHIKRVLSLKMPALIRISIPPKASWLFENILSSSKFGNAIVILLHLRQRI